YYAVEFKDKLGSHESATVLSMISKNKSKKDVYMNCWLFENQHTAARWLAERPVQKRNYAVWINPCHPVYLRFDFDMPYSISPRHEGLSALVIANAIYDFWKVAMLQLSEEGLMRI